jgi:hypothetical protein
MRDGTGNLITELGHSSRCDAGDEPWPGLRRWTPPSSSAGKIVGGPEIQTRGSGTDNVGFSAGVLPKVVNALGRAANAGVTDARAPRQLARRTIGTWVSGNYRRPMIIPVVVEV